MLESVLLLEFTPLLLEFVSIVFGTIQLIKVGDISPILRKDLWGAH